jgi:hypothetical protein
MAATKRLAPCLVFLALLSAPLTLRAQESWDAVYISGAKVGYYHTKVEPVNDDAGNKFLRVRFDTTLNFKRDRDTVSILMQYGTIETLEGAVLKLETRLGAGQAEQRTHGEVRDGKMVLALEAGGVRQEQEIPWGPDVRGPYAAELSLSREPMKPGQTRRIKMFTPFVNKIGITTLTAHDIEQVELGGKVKRSLMRVEGKLTDMEGKPMLDGNSTYWVDSKGQILKTFTDVFGGQATYRTTKDVAMAPAGAKFDLVKDSIIRLKNRIPNPEATRDIVYRVRLQDDDPMQVFPADRRQKVKKGTDEHTAMIEVRTAGPDQGEQGPADVGEEFLRANPQINCGDAKVIEHTRAAVGNRADPWGKAVAIEHWVFTNMRNKNFETTFATAAEVAQTLSGDCTEHSVLTAAMCRAAGIPARVAVGVVYADHLGGFGFHQWNEVYVNRRWVALDASFDQSQVDAVHIKLTDSSLDGVSPFETFMGVVKLFKKTGLDVVEIR